MSYDIWGQLIGKATRRELEGDVKVAAGPLLVQVLGGAATAAAVSHFGPGAGALASAFVGGALKLSPPSGLMTPVSPGTVPLIPAIVQAVSVIANKPAAAKAAKQVQAAATAQAEADKNQAAAKEAADTLAARVLAAQQDADAQRQSTWEAEAEQIAEKAAASAVEKYLERTGKFSPAELGKAEAVIGEAESVAEELPQTGVVETVTGALKTVAGFVADVVTHTEAEKPTQKSGTPGYPAEEGVI